MRETELFDRLIDISAAVSGESSLRGALASLAKTSGFDRFAYLNLQAGRTMAVSNYPREWQARYLKRSYMSIDPVVAMARRHMRLFEWSAEQERKRASKEVERFYAEASEFGIRSGLSIPICTGFGQLAILTLASQSSGVPVGHEADAVTAASAAAMIHARFSQQPIASSGIETVVLTGQERVCLRWIAEGKTMHEIVTVGGLKYGTVRFHLSSAKRKLNVVSLPQATAVATKLTLI
ncbi:LuxR family transcriptional activator of conjugal transfer of Ti plasmids [Rhizobium sp. BK251]|nr:LuxR family transcriptional activator of conjugal transfer of Ti plasmids [Rhizobium sp. BK251]